MFFGRTFRFFGLGYVSAWLLCSQIEAATFSRFFEFDIAGNLKKVVSADLCSIDYEYDEMQRLVKVTDSQGKVFSYQYDVNSNCIQAKDENGIVNYEYDLLNRLVSATYSGIAPIRYSYDLRERVQQIIYPGEIQVFYSYDTADRLISVDSPHGKTQYVYDQICDTLSKVILPNGITTEYGYDKAKRVTSVFHRRSDKTLVVGFQYVFDGNGNRIRMEEINENSSKIVDFSYDKLNRLIDAKYSEGYDENNRLIKANDIQFFYDARGNLVKKISPDKTVEYAYDIHDNLIMYSDEEYNVTYAYDSEGRRISKVVNGEKTFYINNVHSPITQVPKPQKKREQRLFIFMAYLALIR